MAEHGTQFKASGARTSVSAIGRQRILVVDDEEVCATLIGMALMDVGFDARYALDGDTALRLVAAWKPDRRRRRSGVHAPDSRRASPAVAAPPILHARRVMMTCPRFQYQSLC